MNDSSHPRVPDNGGTPVNGDAPEASSMGDRELLEATYNELMRQRHMFVQMETTLARVQASGVLTHHAANRAEMAALDASIEAREAKIAALELAKKLADKSP